MADWIDPYRNYNFKLDIQGVVAGHFSVVDGFGIKIESIDYREGGNNQIVHRIPGRVQYGDVTLRYGLTKSRELWDWFMKGVHGTPERRNVSIVLLDSDASSEALRWNLVEAWVSEWRGAKLDALGKEMAIESVTLAFNTLNRD